MRPSHIRSLLVVPLAPPVLCVFFRNRSEFRLTFSDTGKASGTLGGYGFFRPCLQRTTGH